MPPIRLLIITLLILTLGGILLASRKHTQSNHSPDLELLPLKTDSGWGYQIQVDHHPFITQPYIPVLSGRRPFPDKDAAMRTGRLVIQKLKSNQRPILSNQDLKDLGLISDSL